MNTQFETLLSEVNRKISDIQFDSAAKNLYAPIGYTLDLGGKRIRPVLTLMSNLMFGGTTEQAISAALAIEIFHNFTLLHDDVMDHADIRRGKPTVHKKWNENTAILSGDAMLIVAYQYLAGTNPQKLPAVLNVFSKTALEVCEGQQFDMEFETRTDVEASEYIEMIRLKTAVLLGCALKIGAIIGGADIKQQESIYKFGEAIGLAFQLKDDLLDVYGDSAKFGKNIGGDITSNKKTYLLIQALQQANTHQKADLNTWINAVEFERDLKIKAVTELYNQIGVKQMAEDLMNTYYQQAIQHLQDLGLEAQKTAPLENLAEKLMYREF
ncbi:MAG: polyprenyl synthetase family protein [Bacteroidales bacterium]